MTFLLSNRPDVTAEFVKQGINPRLSVLQQYASQYPNYGAVAEELPYVGPIPAVKNWVKMEDALATAISNALLNVKTAKDALDEAQAQAAAAAKQ
jgi:ABC-type glycerol-3-phosphate transport system substrate-binding protein